MRTEFYKKNEAQICPKIENKLKIVESQLQMQMYLQYFIEKQHIHVITCGVSLQVFLQLQILSEQRRNENCATLVL